MILSKSKQGLDKCLKILESFNTKWLLNIDYKRTETIIFHKTGRKQKNLSFYINNASIEIVQEYTYLGITIDSSGTLTIAQKLLADKDDAIYKIRQRIDISRFPLRSAMKIFN